MLYVSFFLFLYFILFLLVASSCLRVARHVKSVSVAKRGVTAARARGSGSVSLFYLLHKSHESHDVRQLGNYNAHHTGQGTLLTAATVGTVGASVHIVVLFDQPMFLETVANITSHMPPVFQVEV